MAIKFINLKELLESLVLVINLKRLLKFNVIKEKDRAWVSCDSLYDWLWTQSRFIAISGADM